MPNQNKIKLIVGLILVIAAFGAVALLIYMMGDANMQSQKKIAALELQLTNLIGERAANRMSPLEASRAAGTPITLKALVDRAEGVYSEEEKKQKEGFLWIDREAKTVMITLGALNGLGVGSILSVYEKDDKIDTVKVETIYDVISYVTPISKKFEDYGDNYYRVVYEGGR